MIPRRMFSACRSAKKTCKAAKKCISLYMNEHLDVHYLGTVPYRQAFEHQLELHRRRTERRIPDTLLLLEHPHVYTLGRHADESNIMWGEAERRRRGVSVEHVDRGGDVTYHGPGQLVGYPLIGIRDRGMTPRRLVEWVEMLVMETLSGFGIDSYVHPDYPGVWVGDAKICAIGMRIRNGVSYHGFALNVSTDLEYFGGIVPCGIRDKRVCSVNSVLNRETDMKDLRERLSRIAAQTLPAASE
jgi:lipoyl(octanoyl) transferase